MMRLIFLSLLIPLSFSIGAVRNSTELVCENTNPAIPESPLAICSHKVFAGNTQEEWGTGHTWLTLGRTKNLRTQAILESNFGANGPLFVLSSKLRFGGYQLGSANVVHDVNTGTSFVSIYIEPLKPTDSASRAEFEALRPSLGATYTCKRPVYETPCPLKAFE